MICLVLERGKDKFLQLSNEAKENSIYLDVDAGHGNVVTAENPMGDAGKSQ